MKVLIILLTITTSSNLFADDSLKYIISGKLQSRIIISKTLVKGAPTVYLIPGSGPHGPEEMMPASVTLDGKNHSLFLELAKELNQIGFNCVLIGKPGIDFSKPDSLVTFYDKALYKSLTWDQYLENIESVIDETNSHFESDKKIILGHSEGTIAALHLAERRPYTGLFLLGYTGQNLRKTLYYQTVERLLMSVQKLDLNLDQVLSKNEWINYPEFSGLQKDDIPFNDFLEIGKTNYAQVINQYENFNLWKGEVFDGEDTYSRMANLKIPIHVFQGELDSQTPIQEVHALETACKIAQKNDCFTHIIPGVGHGFSAPRSPRKDPVFDSTIGPMSDDFYEILKMKLSGSWP